ncbi:MAG TPA: VWA domain-containing protein [Thermoanaerobaculia bacterium]
MVVQSLKSFLLAGALMVPAAIPAAADVIPPSGEPAAQAPEQGYTEAIDVRVVNVEAVVTDRKGERLRGLKASDFRLLVDGKEVPIDYFTEVVDGTAAPAGSAAASGDRSVPAPMQGAVGRSVLIFVDQAFSLQTQLEQVVKRLNGDLDRLGAGDQVAVVAFDGQKLSVLADWTSDKKVVHAALDKAAHGAAGGAQIRTERTSLRNDAALRRLADAESGIGEGDRDFFGFANGVPEAVDMASVLVGPDGTPDSSFRTPFARNYSGVPWIAVSRAHRTLAAAVAALRGFSGAPGRKTALLLSGGWPVDLAPSLYPALIDTANRLSYTLYPVDVPGIETSPVPIEASEQGPFRRGAPHGEFISSRWELDSQYGMELLANWTGGKSSLNSNRLTALDRLVADTGTYYWIGFSPSWRGDGRRHSVRLESRRSGIEVRSRRSFTDVSRAAESAMSIEGELMLGRTVPEKKLYVELGSASSSGLSAVEVPITLGVPSEALSFVQTAEGYQAELPLHVTSLDDSNDPLDLPPVVLRAVVKQVPPAGELVRFQSTFRIRRGERVLRFTVQDAVHDKLLWGEATISRGGGKSAK